MRPETATFRTGSAVFALSVALALPSSGAAAAEPPAKAEYYERLAKLHPRDATAHVELAGWCEKAGLAQEAAELYRRAIEIDSDCEAARQALGYRRWGLAWVKPEDLKKPRRQPLPPGVPGGASAEKPAAGGPSGPREAPAAATGEAPGAKPEPPAPSPPGPPPGAGTTEGTPQPEARKLEPARPASKQAAEASRREAAQATQAELEKKRAWAAEAARKASVSFATEEDDDFLIHTTLPRSSAELREFKANLRAVKKTLTAVLALRAGTRIWPAKIQFVLLRSAPEFERFAELADGIPAPRNPEGAYTKDDHTVVLRPDTPLVPRLLGTTALQRLDGSDRHVGWWLVEGLGEWLYAQSAAGTAQGFLKDEYLRAAEILKAEGSRLRIFDLIDSAENLGRDAVRNRTLAFTLFDFLVQLRARGVAELVSALKSEKAPAPPASKEESAAFFASYTSFQETAFVAAFRKPVAEIEERWKQYVLARAEGFRAKEPGSPAAPKAPRPRG